MEELIGYGLAIAMGCTMGLLGGGGSILTVPILVYLLGVEETVAPGYSLFLVGFAAIVGSLRYAQAKAVSVKTAIAFATPSAAGVYAAQKWLLPAVPDVLFQSGQFEFSKGQGIMVLFAVLMLLASIPMIRQKDKPDFSSENQQFNWPLILLEGLGIGLLTGLVGAGGGFMIVPALVVLSKLPMRLAVGTSLLIMAAKSLLGFVGAYQSFSEKGIAVDWKLLLIFLGLSLLGILVGTGLSQRIPGQKLKPFFGWFVLFMGVFVIVQTVLEA